MIYCYECGHQVSEKAISCVNCGAPFETQKANEISTNESKQPINEFSRINVFKWITVSVLLLSVAFFFCPYAEFRFIGSFNPIQMLNDLSENRYIPIYAIFEVIIAFIVPVVLTAISAVIMVFKVCIPRCIICLFLNVLSVGVYLLFFNFGLLDINSGNIRFGLIGNIIVSCLGVLLPIILLILTNTVKRSTETSILTAQQ